LPDAVHNALEQFDEQMAKRLERIADGIEGKAPRPGLNLEESHDRLEAAIRAYSEDQLQTLTSLLRTAVGLIISFDRDCGTEPNLMT